MVDEHWDIDIETSAMKDHQVWFQQKLISPEHFVVIYFYLQLKTTWHLRPCAETYKCSMHFSMTGSIVLDFKKSDFV